MCGQPSPEAVVVRALQLAEDICPVRFHRTRAAGWHQDPGDTLVGLAKADQARHLAFAA